VQQALQGISADRLCVHLNSGGGEVWHGIAIYNVLRDWADQNNAKIEMRIDAIAASIASVIAMAGDDIVIAKNAVMMIHRASGGCWGTADDMRKTAEILDVIETSQIIPSYQQHVSLSADALIEMMKAETWMNAEEAVSQGFATSVADDEEEGDEEPEALLRPGLYAKAPKALRCAKPANQKLHTKTPPRNVADWVCAARLDHPVTERDSYNASAAAERILDWAGFNGDNPDPGRAKCCFLAYDASEPKSKDSYVLPFCDIIGGIQHAISKGWDWAESKIDGLDIPQPVKDSARAAVEAYEAKIGEDDDEDEEGEDGDAKDAAEKAAAHAHAVAVARAKTRSIAAELDAA